MSRILNREQLEVFRVKYRKSNRARKKTLLTAIRANHRNIV